MAQASGSKSRAQGQNQQVAFHHRWLRRHISLFSQFLYVAWVMNFNVLSFLSHVFVEEECIPTFTSPSPPQLKKKI